MSKSIEDIAKSLIQGKTGKNFQQLVWDILICYYPDFQTPEMNHDLGNDGYSIEGQIFIAVYAPEKYDNKETAKKIQNDDPNNLGDYNKFVKNWKNISDFKKWIFVTKDNLMGSPHQKIVQLNSIKDGIKKEHWGLEQLLKMALGLKNEDLKRIFNLPSELFGITLSQANEVETIIDLIEYMSNHCELSERDFEKTVPDPDRKIYERFKEYCKSIENEIKEYAVYYNARKAAEEAIGLDILTVAKTRGYLKYISKRFLREYKNNPMDALDALTDYFDGELKLAGKNYDYNAIRFYLISEIPKCNVFPNDE